MADEEYKRIFSKNLRYYMEKNQKNQMDLMNDLGLSSSTVSNWCTGLKLPRMDKVQMLADYFGIMKSDLIEEKSDNDSDNFASDPDIRRIQRARNNMDQKNRDKMMKILEASFEDYFGDDYIDNDND